MDFFHIYLLYKLSYLFEKAKINEKEAGDGPFLKEIVNFFSHYMQIFFVARGPELGFFWY